LIAGLKYMLHDRTIGLLLLMNFLMVLFSMPYMQMLPGFVKDILHGGAAMQGALMSFSSVGMVVAALAVASLPNRHRGTLLLWGGLILGVALTAFSFSSLFWVTAPVMILLGAGQSLRMALSNALVQSYVEDEYRGRVMSIYMMEMNLVTIGAFFVAIMAEVFGVQWALGVTSLALVVLSVGCYFFVPRLRAIQ
jgi:MFS family permease